MTPVVSIIMGSTSDLPVMEKAAKLLGRDGDPVRNACVCPHTALRLRWRLSPKELKDRGIKVIIAAAGMAAHLVRCDRLHDDGSGDRRAHQLHAGRYGCPVGYRTDASGNPCGYCRHQWRFERWYPCGADACRRRRATSGEAIRL